MKLKTFNSWAYFITFGFVTLCSIIMFRTSFDPVWLLVSMFCLNAFYNINRSGDLK